MIPHLAEPATSPTSTLVIALNIVQINHTIYRYMLRGAGPIIVTNGKPETWRRFEILIHWIGVMDYSSYMIQENT